MPLLSIELGKNPILDTDQNPISMTLAVIPQSITSVRCICSLEWYCRSLPHTIQIHIIHLLAHRNRGMKKPAMADSMYILTVDKIEQKAPRDLKLEQI